MVQFYNRATVEEFKFFLLTLSSYTHTTKHTSRQLDMSQSNARPRWTHEGLRLLKPSERCSLEQHSKELLIRRLLEEDNPFVSTAYNCRLSAASLAWTEIWSVQITSFCSPCQNLYRLAISYLYFVPLSYRVIQCITENFQAMNNWICPLASVLPTINVSSH